MLRPVIYITALLQVPTIAITLQVVSSPLLLHYYYYIKLLQVPTIAITLQVFNPN
jgi:hypothetical protein